MSSTRIEELISRMTMAEKVGQLCQAHAQGRDQEAAVRAGALGSLLNAIGGDARHYQRLAVEESRLGIPLLLGRDVIHGFRTVFPIPLGQAATFDPDGVREAAAASAREAAAEGINWTFSPMLDVARDPRWGRIAESFGEDTLLAQRFGVAMVEGYQRESIAACAKHFVGYGAAEGGRDYSQTSIPERQLRDVYLPPFQSAVQAGVMSVMSAFHDLDGVPMTGHEALLHGTLKRDWGFDGLVVSDWNSVAEMIVHGFAEDEAEAARKALIAGIDIEMVSRTYAEHLQRLLQTGSVPQEKLDDAVRRVLRIKERLGLFDAPYGPARPPLDHNAIHALAREQARRSCVLLKNDGVLPVATDANRIALIGPLADAAQDQLGCWVLDGDASRSRTLLAALRDQLGDSRVAYAPGLPNSRSDDDSGFAEAIAAARRSDVAVLCIGEDAALSGEAHCRAHIGLPGAQQRLLEAVAGTGVPVVVIVFSGRPLVLAGVVERANALLLAWHPGSQGGPAIADLLFGDPPSGRLPVSLPRSVGQVPIYYSHRNTGRPPLRDAPSIPSGTPLDPSGFYAAYLDEDHRPLFPFGFGLGYTSFEYADLRLSDSRIPVGDELRVSVELRNTGPRAGTEVVQLYVRDLFASVTRPVKELKDFRRVNLQAGESCRVEFTLHTDQLAFHGLDSQRIVEPGRFELWVAGSADGGLVTGFELTA